MFRFQFSLGDNASTGSLGIMPPPSALASVSLMQGGPTCSTVLSAWSSPITMSTMAPLVPLTDSTTVPPLSTSMVGPGVGVSLSPATEPFPRKLVDRIRSGQYIEMRDLLMDNISLRQQLESLGGPAQYSLPGIMRPRLRDVGNLPSWMYCFLAYVALRSGDSVTRDMLAYARLVIRESQRHGGNSWLEYDKVFRQQAAIDNSLRWNTLHPGIQAATLMGRSSGVGTFCSSCRGTDHTAPYCALAYLQGPSTQQPRFANGPGSLPGVSRSKPPYQFRKRPETSIGICVSWNKGKCSYPNTCRFRHICATCNQQHMARDCVSTPGNSEYRSNTQLALAPYQRRWS